MIFSSISRLSSWNAGIVVCPLRPPSFRGTDGLFLVINALRAKSGFSGLSAFLPPHDKIYTSVWEDDEDEDDEDTLNNIDMDAIAKMDLGDLAFDGGDDDDINESRSHDSSFETTPSFSPPPHLPLVSHYQEGDFSLTEVLPKHRRGGGGGKKTDIREWTLQLLQRYRFVLGDTPTRFQMITSLNDARSKLKQVEMDKNAVSFIPVRFIPPPHLILHCAGSSLH